MVPLAQGIPLGTDLAHYLLFGYGAEEYPGRAVIDAIGEEIPLDIRDVVFRTSWATVEPLPAPSSALEPEPETLEAPAPREGYGGFKITNRFTPSLTREEVESLVKALPKTMDGYTFEWRFSHDSHGFLIIRGCGLDPQVSDVDPFYEGQLAMRVVPFETASQEALQLSELVNRYILDVHERLASHEVNHRRRENGQPEANFMLLKWAGRYALPEPFHLRNGMSGAVIASSKLLKGVAASLGMDYFDCPDYGSAVRLAHQLDYEFVLVHTKSPDTAAHTKNPLKKVAVLEALDPAFETITATDDVLYIITGDHSTASSGTLIHSGESVPVVFLGSMTRRDLGGAFNEVACGLGGLRITSGDMMPMVLNFTDRAKLYHLRAGAHRRLYRATHDPVLKQSNT
jgi:2,3-bisphosphoglycerate-independent phosphoglycerate mutase